jgi:hypothetical protein
MLAKCTLVIVLVVVSSAVGNAQSSTDPNLPRNQDRSRTEGATTITPNRNSPNVDLRAPTAPEQYRKGYGDKRPSGYRDTSPGTR